MFPLVLIAVSILSVVLHSTDADPFTVNLSTIAVNQVVGQPYSGLGRDVAQIGDHNGDGFSDYIVGDVDDNKAVVVMKGVTTHSKIIDVASVFSGQHFLVIRGPASSGLGSTVGGIGDINGDSFDDLIVGAAYGDVPGRGEAGYAFVIFGMKGPFTDLTVTATWTASAIGFMMIGPANDVGFMNRPRSARGLGDVNGDGVDDFAVACNTYSGTTGRGFGAGVVWLIFGRNGTIFDTIDLLPEHFGPNGVYLLGVNDGDYFGHTVMPAGDFNGDGIADFLVGAPNAKFVVNGVSRSQSGAAFLLFGSKTAYSSPLDMATFVTGAMGVCFGADADNELGSALTGVGDVNGDGIDDIALGAKYADCLNRASSGIVYVIFGNSGTYKEDVDLRNYAASMLGFAIYGRETYIELHLVSPAGDINNDGVGDLIVADSNALHIVHGQTAIRTSHVDTLVDNVTSLFYSVVSYTPPDPFSFEPPIFSVASLDGGKDLDGDGVPDLLFGSPFVPQLSGYSVSAVWMISGPVGCPGAPRSVPRLAPNDCDDIRHRGSARGNLSMCHSLG